MATCVCVCVCVCVVFFSVSTDWRAFLCVVFMISTFRFAFLSLSLSLSRRRRFQSSSETTWQRRTRPMSKKSTLIGRFLVPIRSWTGAHSNRSSVIFLGFVGNELKSENKERHRNRWPLWNEIDWHYGLGFCIQRPTTWSQRLGLRETRRVRVVGHLEPARSRRNRAAGVFFFLNQIS